MPRTGRTTRSGAAADYATTSAVPLGDTDWQEVAIFGAGLALGVILGAGGALLTAPRTGAETRAALGARAARLRRTTVRSSQNAWDELRDELRQAKRNRRNRKLQKRAMED
ncbi:MAG TPA: YtxH domain-containing protein [Gemmatimonadaceae bacterium]|nr:YtxH domain-containing protein [Gemmatimonadaceae bacterium]